MEKFLIKGCESCKYMVCKNDLFYSCTYGGTEKAISLYHFQTDDEIENKRNDTIYLKPNICDNWVKIDKT